MKIGKSKKNKPNNHDAHLGCSKKSNPCSGMILTYSPIKKMMINKNELKRIVLINDFLS